MLRRAHARIGFLFSLIPPNACVKTGSRGPQWKRTMFNILRALKWGQTDSRQKKHPSYVPRLECLEDRLAPSVSTARILISPLTATNAASTQSNPNAGLQTLMAEVDISADGVTWTPESGATVNFSLLNNIANAFFVGPDFGVTGANGQTTATINSTQGGTANIQATGTFTINGVGGTFSVTTGTGSPNSANATVTYLSLGPGSIDDF